MSTICCKVLIPDNKRFRAFKIFCDKGYLMLIPKGPAKLGNFTTEELFLPFVSSVARLWLNSKSLCCFQEATFRNLSFLCG